MSTLVSIEGDPNEVRATGALLKAQSADLGSQASALAAEIEAKEADQPWGNDHFGASFKDQPNGYFSVPEGANKPFNDVLKDELNNAGAELSRTADGIIGAMNDYQLTDGLNSRQIKDVGAH